MNTTDEGLGDSAAFDALMAAMENPNGNPGETEDADEDYEEFEPEAEDLEDHDEGEEGPEDHEDEGHEEGEESTEEEGEEEPGAAPEALADDAELTFTGDDGQPLKMTVADLKQLHGERESFKVKGAEADLVGTRAAAALRTALDMVAKEHEPYRKLDWMVARDNMDPETFAWHRQNAQRLQGQFDSLMGAAKGVEQAQTARQATVDADAAAAALKTLKADIPEWSDAHYDDILKYGVSQGLDQNDLNNLIDPKVIKILRKAMLHDKAATVVTKKVKAAPVKPIAGNKTAPQATARKAINTKKAMTRLAQTGSDSAAMAALMGRWA